MIDYLFSIGDEVKVMSGNEMHNMLIIGKRTEDEERTLHDYAGVPYPEGFKGRLYFFEHRDIVERVV